MSYHASVATVADGQTIKKLAAEVGFDRCGITAAEPLGSGEYLRSWLRNGRAGSMDYLHQHFNLRLDPRGLLEGARSVIVVALLYRQSKPASASHDRAPRGRVAMYAWGDDYHRVVKKKLFALVDRMQTELDEPFGYRACVDTAPLIEREFAARAGVGWIGKNTMVLHQDLGSFFFLGVLITTLDLPSDQPAEDHCGQCTACLDACPTDAFPAAYEMDASRCISYLTIEHRGDISKPFQDLMGEWIFGCDVCQDVCPFNRGAPSTSEPRFAVRSPGPEPSLDELQGWSIEDYRRELKGSAMKRAKLEMLKRNAQIAKNNAAPQPPA